MTSVTCVLGIGNVLLGDDGVGVWLVRHLRKAYAFTPEIEAIDGGTLGLELMPYFSGRDRVLVIDAAKSSVPPGTVSLLTLADLAIGGRQAISAHDASLVDLLAALALTGDVPRELVAITIEPLCIEPSIDLSAPVRAALPQAESAIIAQLAGWGISARNLDVSGVVELAL